MVIFDMMSVKVEKLLLELSEEVFRVCPKTKKEFRKMVSRYSFRNGENKMVVLKNMITGKYKLLRGIRQIWLLMLIVTNWLERVRKI